jgi:hypothetical protein
MQCTVLAAAVIGAFSWTTVEEAYWLTHGLWHSSLILAVLGILLSASEVTVLHILGPVPLHNKPGRGEMLFRTYRPLLISETKTAAQSFIPRKKMVFTWQGPLMFMSYSVCAFLVGLTVLVCTPFIRREKGATWSAGENVSPTRSHVELNLNTSTDCSDVSRCSRHSGRSVHILLILGVSLHRPQSRGIRRR